MKINKMYDPVVNLLRNVKKQGNNLVENGKLDNPFKIYFNTISHQKTNSECGMYSIFLIVQSEVSVGSIILTRRGGVGQRGDGATKYGRGEI